MILEVKALSFHYHNGKDIFSNVSFCIEKGEIMSILGANGTGKTTLLNCIANLYKPQLGKILLEGKSMQEMKLKTISRIMGYVPQIHFPTYSYSVLEFAVMGRTPYIGIMATPNDEDYEIASESLKKMGVFHLRDKPYTEISGGERQQVTIARVLAQQPSLILLDEPTAHLDYGNQYRTIQLIKNLSQEGYAIVLTTHNPDHAIVLGGKVGILDRTGVLSVGMADDVLTGEILSPLYGINLKTKYDKDAKRRVCIAYA